MFDIVRHPYSICMMLMQFIVILTQISLEFVCGFDRNSLEFLNVSVFFKMLLYYSNKLRKIKGPMAKTDNISFICFILL